MNERKINNRVIEIFFFSNLFLIPLSLSLNFETVLKMNLQFNSVSYYIFISSVTVLFYLYAYRIPKSIGFSKNPREQFYIQYRSFINIFSLVLIISSLCSGLFLLKYIIPNYQIISWKWILILFATIICTIGYYDYSIGISLRKIMWLKPFLIGWSWAITTVFMPILFLMLENGKNYALDDKFYFLFTQTFMYCVVNAILFDLKDYEDDSNKKLKTFVVKYGYYFTLNKIIIPLIFLGFLSFLAFGLWYGLPPIRIIFMLIPIFLLLIFAIKLNQPKTILYYLIVIDGMIFFKAIFGILSVILFE